MSEEKFATVHILDKPYQMRCGEQEIPALLESANYLDSKMRDTRDSGRGIGLERVAVVTALNIAHELLLEKQRHDREMAALRQQVQQFEQKIASALSD